MSEPFCLLKKVFLRFFLLAISVSSLSCGQLNKHQQQNVTGEVKVLNLDTPQKLISVHGTFQIFTHVKSSPQMNLAVAAVAHSFDNVATLKIFKIISLSNIVEVGSNSTIEGQYYLFDPNKKRRPHPLVITRNPNGEYQANISARRKGTWEVFIKINDGTVSDDFVFQFKIL